MYDGEVKSLSPATVTAQDIANWVGVFEAYGEVIQQIIARDIPTEQKEQLQSLYGVISAVLMDYNQVVSHTDFPFANILKIIILFVYHYFTAPTSAL